MLNKEVFMTINIDDKVLDYLKKINSKAITIDLIGCASWGVGEPQPVVSPSEPKKDKEEFKLIKSGDIDVYVKNKATAALYTYTPYQPNEAALNNMYGLGDRCSAYGNRNFYNMF